MNPVHLLSEWHELRASPCWWQNVSLLNGLYCEALLRPQPGAWGRFCRAQCGGHPGKSKVMSLIPGQRGVTSQLDG